MAKETKCCTSPEVLKKISEYAAQYKGRQDMLLEVLHTAQKAAGNYLPEDVIVAVATAMDLPIAKVYTVVEFYAFFSTKPRGEHIIRMCTNAPGHVRYASDTLKRFEQVLGIQAGETTPDGKFTLEKCSCMGLCDCEPAIMIDETVYGPVYPEDVRGIVEKY